MEQFSFGHDVAFVPRGDLLDRVSMAPLTQPFEEGALVQAAIFRFCARRPDPSASRDVPTDSRRTRGIRRSERGEWRL
jgi:hypothetical protein